MSRFLARQESPDHKLSGDLTRRTRAAAECAPVVSAIPLATVQRIKSDRKKGSANESPPSKNS
ncbi:MAG: hypothetical protein R3F11_01490 [Verrucomicrobiales bacterium]